MLALTTTHHQLLCHSPQQQQQQPNTIKCTCSLVSNLSTPCDKHIHTSRTWGAALPPPPKYVAAMYAVYVCSLQAALMEQLYCSMCRVYATPSWGLCCNVIPLSTQLCSYLQTESSCTLQQHTHRDKQVIMHAATSRWKKRSLQSHKACDNGNGTCCITQHGA